MEQESGLVTEIRAEALERQIERIGTNNWDEIFPETLQMGEIIGYTNATVDRLEFMGKRLVAFTMCLGRLMDLASKRTPAEWKEFNYNSFTEFQETAFAKIRSHGSRFMAMRVYRQLRDVPQEQLEQCDVGNLNRVAQIMSKNPNLSDSQKSELLEIAAKPPVEFAKNIAQSSLVPPGEETTRTITLRGHVADVDFLEEELEKDEIKALGPNDVARILCWHGEYTSSGPSAVAAAVILGEIAAKAAQLKNWDLVVDEEFTGKIKAWLGQSTPTVGAIDAEYEADPE